MVELLTGKTTEKAMGFTIVELIVVIILIGVLTALASASLPGSKATARDSERRSDASTIARTFEQQYIKNSSTSYPSYPSTGSLSTDTTVLSGNGLSDALKAPDASSSSLSAATSTASQTPTVSQYIYQPFYSDDTLCTTRSSTLPCVRFKLWYRQEADNQVITIESQRQQ